MANTPEKLIEELNMVTEAALRTRATLESLIQMQMKAPSADVQRQYASELNREIGLIEHRNRLLQEYNTLLRQQQVPVNSSNRRTYSYSTGENDPIYDRARNATNNRYGGSYGGSRPPGAGFGGGHPNNPSGGNDQPPPGDNGAADRARAAAERKAAAKLASEAALLEKEAARLAYINAQKFLKEEEHVKSQGFKNPRKAFIDNTKEAGATYSTSRYSEFDENGRKRTLTVRSDEQGMLTNAPIQKKSQSFAQGIGKDIGDLLKWSVAIAAIYGPINAVSEAMTQLIENESKLADVSIFLSDGLANTNKVFSTVSSAAQSSGESVSGVIDAFGAAYTAAGRITNEVERYSAATSLLDDALALSKISTLDQAGAIDVLTAALYQTADSQEEVSAKLGRQANQSDVAANALANGKNLLDQWVLVSKSAAVSVETLATGVAVLGDSAETAGLRVEQMNAMIATLSEVSLSSGKETANIAKALIGNYQQESAVKESNRLGISVVDTTGKTRQFLDVMKDVYALRKGGILGDQDFNRLTLALGGGGIRRQKDVAAFIENMSRMEQLTAIQDAGAGGQTEAAMAKKLDTVQTSTTQLQNSLVSLAQTMGTEGGLLDMFSGAAKGATAMVNAINAISSSIGKLSPILMAVGVGSLIMRGKGGAAGMQSLLMNNLGMGAGMAGGITGTRSIFSPNGMSTIYGSGGGISSQLPMTFGQQMTTLPTMLSILGPAIQNFASNKPEEGSANLVGGAIGAAAGAAFGAAPIGALVGSAIAEAFVKTTITYDKSFVGLFAGVAKQAKDKEDGAGGGKKSLTDLLNEVYVDIGGGSFDKGAIIVKQEQQRAYREAELAAAGGDKYKLRYARQYLKTNEEGKLPGQYLSPDAAAMALIEKTNPDKAKALRLRMAEEGLQPEGYQTRQTKEQIKWSSTGQIKELNSMQQTEMDRLKKGVISGDIKQSDYANRMASLSAFTTTATGWMAAVTDGSGKLDKAFESNADAWNQFMLIMGSGNQEAIKNINSLISEATKLQDILDNWDPKTKGVDFTALGQEFAGVTDKKVLENALGAVQTGLSAAINSSSNNAMLSIMKVRDVYGSNTTATSGKDVNTVTQDAIKLQNQYYSNLTKKEYEAKKDSFEEFYMWIDEGGKYIYKKITDSAGKNIDKNLFGEAFQADLKSGKIKPQDQGIDWQVGQATEAQYRAAEAKAPAFTKMLESKGVTGLKPLEETVVTTSDKQTIVSHGDQKVIQYLLQQILDTEKKQLQGIWNLPEGSSFWVPLQSMIDNQNGGMGGEATPGTDNAVAKAVDAEAERLKYEYGSQTATSSTTKGKYDISKFLDTSPRATGPDISKPNPFLTKDMGSATPESSSLIDKLMDILRGIMGTAGERSLGGGKGWGGGNPAVRDGLKPIGSTPSSVQPISNRLDLKLTSTTNLMVDGRVLASIVKPYLAADLLKTNESGGTTTRSYVI